MSYEARTGRIGDVLCAKSTFFLAYAAIRNDPSLPTALLAGFGTVKGKTVLFSVLWSAMCENHVLFCIGSEQKLPHHYRRHYSRV